MENTVQRKIILDFVTSLGFDPEDVYAVTMVHSEVTVTVFDKVSGYKVYDPTTGGSRKSTVVLYVVD